MNELEKLEKLLTEKGVACTRTDESEDDYHDFHQIKVESAAYNWDVICQRGSYGNEEGLLEYRDDIESDVIGYLTAEDVMELMDTNEYRRGYQDALFNIRMSMDGVTPYRRYKLIRKGEKENG